MMLLFRPTHNKRWFLVSLIVVECLVLGVGGLVGQRIVRHQMAAVIGEQVKIANARYAEALAGAIEAMQLGETSRGTPGWQKMQDAVEGVQMPADGFVCILDAENKVICHPDLAANQRLFGRDLSSHLNDIDRAVGEDGQTQVGASYFLDGVHYMATREIAGTGNRLVVHQPAQGLISVSDALTGPLLLTFAGVGAAVLLLTVAGSYAVARRYEHTLEAVNAGLEDQVRRRTREHTAARNALIFGLAKLADSRDPETGAHLERLCVFSELIARRLQAQGAHPEVTETWVHDLRLAAALHDIGKVGVADRALRKPGRLNDDERREIERHPLIAADTLLAIHRQLDADGGLVESCIHVALYHHEKWDGSGYPYRLKGEEIPLAARIVAVADVYDALTSKRVYKPAMPHDEACAVIRDGAGKHFDPQVAAAFEAVAEEIDRRRAALQSSDHTSLAMILEGPGS